MSSALTTTRRSSNPPPYQVAPNYRDYDPSRRAQSAPAPSTSSKWRAMFWSVVNTVTKSSYRVVEDDLADEEFKRATREAIRLSMQPQLTPQQLRERDSLSERVERSYSDALKGTDSNSGLQIIFPTMSIGASPAAASSSVEPSRTAENDDDLRSDSSLSVIDSDELFHGSYVDVSPDPTRAAEKEAAPASPSPTGEMGPRQEAARDAIAAQEEKAREREQRALSEELEQLKAENNHAKKALAEAAKERIAHLKQLENTLRFEKTAAENLKKKLSAHAQYKQRLTSEFQQLEQLRNKEKLTDSIARQRYIKLEKDIPRAFFDDAELAASAARAQGAVEALEKMIKELKTKAEASVSGSAEGNAATGGWWPFS